VNQETNPRRSFRQFSLRELLLLMLAVGAFLGWGALFYQQFQRFEPTRYYTDNSDWRDEISAVLQELGEDGSRLNGFAATQSSGRWAAHGSSSYRFRVSAANSAPFIAAFQARVHERMTAAGCNVRSSAASSSGAAQALVLGYSTGPVAGATEVCFFPSDGSHARLVVSMHEARSGSGGPSVGASAARSSSGE
jgi:hypothetical protein